MTAQTSAKSAWRTATPNTLQDTAKWALTAGPLEAFVTLHQGTFYYGVAVKGRVDTARIGRTTTRETALERAEGQLRTMIGELVCFAAERWVDFEWPAPATPSRPPIVCLCGATCFWRTFQLASLQETLAGKIVLSIAAANNTYSEHVGNMSQDEFEKVQQDLDELHLQKIRLADEVLILNVKGYIGESTRRELEYARSLGKPIRFWEEADAK